MLTGGYDEDGTYFRSPPGEELPWYIGGGSSLQLSVYYDIGGKTVYPTDGWLKVNGKAEKVSVTSSERKVLEDQHSLGIFTPKSPGKCPLTVSVADESVKLPILVVPLDIAGNEATGAVIERLGIPDDELDVFVLRPDSKTVHGIHYYDNLKQTSRKMDNRWKFNSFPGAGVVVESKKVSMVSSTETNFDWPKEQERQLQNRLRGR